MAIDLLNLQPHEVSRDLKGKIITLYSAPKMGKTTIISKFPKVLLLATEKGYNAISGIMAQNINKWSEIKQVMKQLEKPEVKEKFETIAFDTIDIAYNLCEKYICQREGVDNIGDIAFGKGYKQCADEFDSVLRSIPMMGFGLIMVSHDQLVNITDDSGNEYQKIMPTLTKRPRHIVLSMSDIIGYARPVERDGESKTALFLRGTPQFEAGSRFKFTPNAIPFNYESLVNCIAEAIEKEEQDKGQEVVMVGENLYAQKDAPTFEEQKKKLKEVSAKLVETKGSDEAKTTIKSLIEGYMGKGKTLKDITPEQVEQLTLIIIDVEDIITK